MSTCSMGEEEVKMSVVTSEHDLVTVIATGLQTCREHQRSWFVDIGEAINAVLRKGINILCSREG